ncbi:uncharacterized protein LOC126705105 [Quercus robur]|uniref:uncharacterized protein LOC126705105 n=1 Tax=Quercus robur TaxID=38942 RepID=UPI002162336A|nr:uncharacterized protein LOC126705105 [Quercus robur]
MEPEFERGSLRSSEEEAELARSVKKFKDNSSNSSFIPPRKQAFRFDAVVDVDGESDTKLEELVDGMVDVHLSKETKARIRAPWTKALIVKVFGRTVGYSYLTFKINALWKPVARMDCIDLGRDFFLIKFHDESDYDKVLRGGPWFVGDHFLAIKPWEPYFQASEASFSSVAVWIRFPELPIEFYDASVLCEIGSAIGPVLRIHSYTAFGSRGSYAARLCIQIDLSKPLITAVRLGRLRQKVMYEGISSLCFCCGRLGHKQENCSYNVKPVEKAKVDDQSSQTSGGLHLKFNKRTIPLENG